MRKAHEPTEEFVERLQWQVSREIRRRNRALDAPRGLQTSRVRLTLAAVALMLASMGIGAAGTAAAYQAQIKERRDQLTATFDQRAALARQRLLLVTSELEATERRVAVGVANNAEVLEGRIKVAEARAQVKSIELQIEEIRITGLEPRSEISAPRVSGRDFVTERLRIEMSVPETVAALERARVKEAETRVSVGVADPTEVEAARVRVLEVEVALETLGKKIDIRQKWLSGLISVVEVELRGLEAEAEQRRKTLGPKVELARREIDRVTKRVQVGTATRVELTEATLRHLQLQTDLLKADLDLALIRRQIEQHREAR
jgi:outer membrane protein TolC